MNINEESVNSNMNLIGHLVPEVSDNLNENSANIPVLGISDNLSIINKSVPEAKSGKNSIACPTSINQCCQLPD